MLWGAGILQELHVTHPGVSRMKALAHSYVYWPGIDKDIERLVSDRATCQEHSAIYSAAVVIIVIFIKTIS